MCETGNRYHGTVTSVSVGELIAVTESSPAEPLSVTGGNTLLLQDLGFDAVLERSFKPRGLVPRQLTAGMGEDQEEKSVQSDGY